MNAHQAYRNFTWQLASQHFATTEGNTCLSPWGPYLLLSMIADSSTGEAKKELKALLAGDEMNGALTLGKVISPCDAVASKTAIYFPDKLATSGIYALNLCTSFSDMSSTPENETDRLTFQSRIGFREAWQTKFLETRKTFYSATTGNTFVRKMIPFIEQVGTFSLKETSAYVSVAVPFEKGCHMTLTMPKQKSLTACLRDPKFLEDALVLSPKGEVQLSLALPKIQLKNFHLNLNNVLQELGVKRIFECENAQVNIVTEKNCYVEKLIQDAEISVDAKGAYALGLPTTPVISSNSIAIDSCSKAICFDHPFAFAIWQTEPAEIPLFIGTIQNAEDLLC